MNQTDNRILSLLKSGLVATILLFAVFEANASHNLAGQFTYIKKGPNTYEITLTTYTEPANAWVDRCYVDFEIYNTSGVPVGIIQNVPRANGPAVDQKYPQQLTPCTPPAKMGEYVFPDIKMNIYTYTHTFSGSGSFLISYEDPARIADVENMDNSAGTKFHVSTLIRNTPQLGGNNSPFFLNHPIDWACVDKLWTHNPGGNDPEGDSLYYRLIPNQKELNTPVDQYKYPNQVGAAGQSFSIDPNTGVITWDVPKQQGWYNIAFIVDEFRNGVKIGEAVRDMAVFVDICQNDPPIIEAITDTCVQAGDTLVLDIKSWDPNLGDSLYFQLNNGVGGNNGPFQTNLTPPATLTFNPPSNIPVATMDTVFGTLRWETNCSHIRKQFYQVDLYAHDNFSYFQGNGKEMLSAHHAIRIFVTPPKLTGLVLTPGPRQVSLSWDQYNCTGAIGYHVYRNMNGMGAGMDTVCCGESPAAAGYELIHSTTSLTETTYDDDLSNVQSFNNSICYVVVVYFLENQMSCPTNVECIELETETFVMTNDSVDVTDSTAGSIFVSWAQPDTSNINKIFFPEPYTYDLYRADGITGNNFTQINIAPIAFDDTTYFDLPLNTVSQGYKYKVEMHDQIGLLSSSNEPSSVYLTTISGDREITLEWSEYVPWSNSEYIIFRADTFTGPYVAIDTVPGTGANTHMYLDTGLTNNEDYCYYVLSVGEYSNINGVKTPLENASQKSCNVPMDRTPPCFSDTDVDTAASCQDFFVHFFFEDLDSLCAGDLSHFNIYFSDRPITPRILVATVPATDSVYFFNDLGSVADCYWVTAVDTVGNESEEARFCFDNCPEFEPSNIFTPNGDGINDWFDPFRHRSVVINEILLFDRWGHQVYGANKEDGEINPNRLWDGVLANGRAASEGVYFYVIDFEEVRLNGNFRHPPLRNHVTLMR